MSTQANPFVAGFSDTADFERIEDGMYQAACCGIVARNFADYNDKSKQVTKCQLLFQVAQDGETYYFKTKPMTPVINEKSNLFIFLQGATGCTLEKIHEKYPNGFPLDNLVGMSVQVVVNTVTGKDGKEYANLANVLKAKKGQQTKVVPDAIPAYLVRDAVSQSLAEGLTVKEDTKAAQAPATPPAQPFGGANKGADPSIPAGAQVTQNPNPAGFMGAAQTNTVPPAEDDDDDSLPF